MYDLFYDAKSMKFLMSYRVDKVKFTDGWTDTDNSTHSAWKAKG